MVRRISGKEKNMSFSRGVKEHGFWGKWSSLVERKGRRPDWSGLLGKGTDERSVCRNR